MANLKKDEPALTYSAVAAVVGYILTALVAHGVITDTQASGLTQTVVPGAVSLAVVGLGWLIRRGVYPAHKVEDVMMRSGLLTDADHARFEAFFTTWAQENLGVNVDWGAEHAELMPTSHAPDVDQLPGGGGMAAGLTKPNE